jgi:toxin YoeB
MRLELEPQALEDLRYWIEQDRCKATRALRVIEQCLRSPFAGSGKPSPLRHALAGCRSRRVDREHRLVYRFEGDSLIVLACRLHY